MYRNTIQSMNETALQDLREQYNQEGDVYDLIDYLTDEGIVNFDSPEDDILDSFTNGNYDQGAKQMLEHIINPRELIDWLEEQREELGEYFYQNISLSSTISIVESYNEARSSLN